MRSGWVFYLISLTLHLAFLSVLFALPKGEGGALEESSRGVCYVRLVEVTPLAVVPSQTTAHSVKKRKPLQKNAPELCLVEKRGSKPTHKKRAKRRVAKKSKPELVKRKRITPYAPKPLKEKPVVLAKGEPVSSPPKKADIPEKNQMTEERSALASTKGNPSKEADEALGPKRVERTDATGQESGKPATYTARRPGPQTSSSGSLGQARAGTGGVVVLPQVSYQVKPAYPPIARRLGYHGRVVVRLLVSASGQVEQVKIVSSSGYRVLDRAAVKALKRWRFFPAQQGGKAVPWWVEVPVVFNLQSS